MAKVSFPISTYVDPNNNVLSLGYLLVRLSQDGNAGSTNLCSSISTIYLDANGAVTGNPTVWPNSQITPTGTYYIVAAYSAQGDLVAGPDKLTV